MFVELLNEGWMNELMIDPELDNTTRNKLRYHGWGITSTFPLPVAGFSPEKSMQNDSFPPKPLERSIFRICILLLGKKSDSKI